MMNYHEALDWLYSTQMFGIKMGLEPTQQLLDTLEAWPPAETRVFHVAGTNGKGSVCAMLDQLCRSHGLRSGLFTSPHLVEFNERIKIDGVPMPMEAVAERLSQLREIVSAWETHPTFFELVTVMALAYFKQQGVDTMVLETGMGGRLDATNVVTPRVSIITRIDLDHQAWLGETLAKIAAEKAGIIKPGVPLVTMAQDEDALAVFSARAAEMAAPMTVVEQPYTLTEVALAGSHQPLHAAMALEAARLGGITLLDEPTAAAMGQVQLDGRFQRLTSDVEQARTVEETRYVLDSAHNPSAAARLVRTWREVFGEERPAIICGSLGDKDADTLIRELGEIAEIMVPAPIRNDRALTPEELSWIIKRYAPGSLAPAEVWQGAESFGDTLTALEALLGTSGSSRKILITGSLFLVGEALAELMARDLPRRSVQ